MTQLTALVWKEWREAQAYLWIGLGLFLGLPLIAAIEFSVQHSHRLEIDASYWITCFGGTLAVFTAVGCTCRDFSGRIEGFWLAAPLSVGRWIAVKFIVGLLIVLIACTLPPLAETITNRSATPMLFYFFYDCFAMTVYSTAFATGCLLRRSAHAASMGLAGMLLICFLPLILPPLAWLNLWELDTDIGGHWRDPRELTFVATMGVLAAAGLLLSIAAVRRNWRIESGAKLIYSSMAAAFLILCASASFQLGTSLPILQKVDLPGGFSGNWANLNVTGNRVILTCDQHFNDEDPQTHAVRGNDVQTFFKFRLDSTGVKLLSQARLVNGAAYWNPNSLIPSVTDNTCSTCDVRIEDGSQNGPLIVQVIHCDENGLQLSTEKSPIKLWNIDEQNNDSIFQYTWNKHLYVLGLSMQRRFKPLHVTRQADIDISDPVHPRLISIKAVNFDFNRIMWGTGDESDFDQHFIVHLPELPELPPRERLKLCLNDFSDALEGDTLCMEHRNGAIAAYQLRSLTDRVATFTRTGVHDGGIVERIFSSYGFGQIQLKNGLLYHMRAIGSGHSYEYILSVYETRGPRPMRMIGHFAAPDAYSFVALPDGRALIGGSKLWLVGPPQRTE